LSAVASSGRPLVSVVTVYYNRVDAVDDSIRSLLDQTYDPLEIVIVDDGSTDGTAERLRRFQDPRIKLIEQANAGFTNAIRAGVAQAGGSLIAVHGSGDISLPERIGLQAEALGRHADAVVVGCRIKSAQMGRETYVEHGPENGLPFRQTLLRRNLFTHGEVMFRRSAYDACGGYRPFFRLAQDVDLWLRMSLAGGYHVVERPLYVRRHSSNGVRTTPEKVLLQKRFSEFARQCAESVDAGQGDLLDRHGAAAPFHMRRSARLANTLARDGARLMVYGDPKRGWPLVEAAFAEKATFRTAAVYALMWTHRFPKVFARVVAPALKRAAVPPGD
jgi:hypothetical protein